MRLKKLLSVVTAVAVALSAVVVAPADVNAAEKTIDMSSCTGYSLESPHTFIGVEDYGSGTNILAGARKVSITYSFINTYDISTDDHSACVEIMDASWNTSKATDATAEEDGSYTVVLDAAAGIDFSQVHLLKAYYLDAEGSQEWNLKVANVSITAISADTTDTWISENDGCYSYTSGQETSNNTSVLSIPAPSSSNGLVLFSANFAIGGGQLTYTKADGNIQSVDVPNGGVQTFIFDSVKADSNITYQKWNLNAKAVEVVSNITMTDFSAETKYIQKTSTAWKDNVGTYSQRFVVLVPEEELQGKSSVSFNISNGNGTATFSSTKYYSTVSVTGNPITAPDGYYFISYAISDIPYDKTLTFVDYSIN